MAAMYIPKYYRCDDTSLHHEIIESYSFATMIVTQNNEPHVVHMPFLLDRDSNTLRGHIARANGLSQLDLSQPYHCLVIFQGPDAYVSPSWYATKQETGKTVPTWNYISVHVKGTLQLINDSEWILQNVSALSDKHEAEHNLAWKVSDAPPAYISAMLCAIVGVEVSISAIDGKFKLSQNKTVPDINGVISGLRAEPLQKSNETARWMERFLPRESTENS